MSDAFVKVGQMNDFPNGMMRKVTVNGEDVLVANMNGKLLAIDNTCTHEGGPLHEGELEGNVVTCPWHGGKFDLTCGKVLEPPPMKEVTCYEVKVQESDVLVRKI